jgi:hypothetical protein
MTEGPKKLHRSNDQRMLAGVCGGLGEYFNTDPTIVSSRRNRQLKYLRFQPKSKTSSDQVCIQLRI